MKVIFEPDKKWWLFWKVNRILKEGKHYTISNNGIDLRKKLKGKIQVEYSYKQNIHNIGN